MQIDQISLLVDFLFFQVTTEISYKNVLTKRRRILQKN